MSFLNLDLNLLRVFDAVMTEQNLTRAAKRLATTQPNVSNSLRRLRDKLDDKLFVRTAHGVTPTPRAHDLRPAIRRALLAMEAAVTPEKIDLSETQTTFRLSLADSTASLLMPPLIRQMKQIAPQLRLQVLPPMTCDPRPLLLQREVDLALGLFPGVAEQLDAEQDAESPLRYSRLYSGEYVCFMRKNHPLAHTELTLDTYGAADHVLVSFSGRAHGLADQVLKDMGRERHIVLTVNQYFTAGKIVEGTDLISIAPCDVIASIRMDAVLIAKKLPFALPAAHIDMLWHARDAANLSHQWLRNTLRAIAEQIEACKRFPSAP